MPSHNVGNQIRKRVQFTLPPNSKGRATVRLNHTQHLAQTSSDVREEHNPQSAYCFIERIVCEWQCLGLALAELNVRDPAITCLILSSAHHLLNGIGTNDRTARCYDLCDRK